MLTNGITCIACVAHNGGVHTHKNMSVYNPPGETSRRTNKKGHCVYLVVFNSILQSTCSIGLDIGVTCNTDSSKSDKSYYNS